RPRRRRTRRRRASRRRRRRAGRRVRPGSGRRRRRPPRRRRSSLSRGGEGRPSSTTLALVTSARSVQPAPKRSPEATGLGGPPLPAHSSAHRRRPTTPLLDHLRRQALPRGRLLQVLAEKGERPLPGVGAGGLVVAG